VFCGGGYPPLFQGAVPRCRCVYECVYDSVGCVVVFNEQRWRRSGGRGRRRCTTHEQARTPAAVALPNTVSCHTQTRVQRVIYSQSSA
jgi:hypothetical protein